MEKGNNNFKSFHVFVCVETFIGRSSEMFYFSNKTVYKYCFQPETWTNRVKEVESVTVETLINN